MQRQSNNPGVVVATAIGLVLFGGMSYASPAEETKKPAEQVAPPATGKAPAAKKGSSEKRAPDKTVTEKKTPDKKAAAKSDGQKAKPAAATPAASAPKYTSAETAANAQACFGEAPKIESMTPDEGLPGDKVTISGRNFGPVECLQSLSFGPGYPATFKLDNNTQITTTVPKGRRTGLAMLTVTTASGEDSKVFVVK